MSRRRSLESLSKIFVRTPPLPRSKDLTFSFSSSSVSTTTNNSAERKQFSLEIPAGVTAAAGAMLASPLAAHAEVTPSLKNLVQSVIAGGVVLVAIIVAVTAVSGFDPVTRGK